MCAQSSTGYMRKLINLRDRTPEERIEIARKGGKASKYSPKHAMSAKIEGLRRKLMSGNLTGKDVEWMTEVMTDEKTLKLEMLKIVKQMSHDPKIPKKVIIDYLEKIDKRLFGEKSIVEHTGHTTHEVHVAHMLKIIKEDKITKKDE